MNVAELVGSVGVVASYFVALPRRPVCHGVDLYGAGRPPEQLPALRSENAHSGLTLGRVSSTQRMSVLGLALRMHWTISSSSDDRLRRPASGWLHRHSADCTPHTPECIKKYNVHVFIHVVLGSSSSLDSLTHTPTHSLTHSLTSLGA